MATTTPNYGWDVPTSTDYVKDGATAIETLGDDIDASLFSITGGKDVGLVHLNTTTLSAVTTVNITNVFTSAYKNYRIEMSTNISASETIYYQLLDGSTAATTNYDNIQNYTFGNGSTGTISALNAGFGELGYALTGGYNGISADIFNPFVATNTFFTLLSARAVGDATYLQARNGASQHRTATAYNGIKVYAGGTSTMTGEISIYGYRR
jgi:hypothetical protein